MGFKVTTPDFASSPYWFLIWAMHEVPDSLICCRGSCAMSAILGFEAEEAGEPEEAGIPPSTPGARYRDFRAAAGAVKSP